MDLTPGQWRLFADFKATGADALTLGADLAVPGVYESAERPEETRTVQVDGYTGLPPDQLTVGVDGSGRGADFILESMEYPTIRLEYTSLIAHR